MDTNLRQLTHCLSLLKLSWRQAIILMSVTSERRQAGLAEDMRMSKVGVTASVKILIKEGLLQKTNSAKDKRIVLLSPTKKGTIATNALITVLHHGVPDRFKTIESFLQKRKLL